MSSSAMSDSDLQPLMSDDDMSSKSPSKSNDHSDETQNNTNVGVRERRAVTACEGILPNGKRFIVPETVSVMKCLTDVRVMKAPSTIIWLFLNLIGLSTYFLYSKDGFFSNWFFNLYFIIWRLGYNIGIGLLLKWQSEERWVEKMVKKHILSNPTYAKMLEAAVVLGKQDKEFKVDTYPEEFSAWMAFRFVVMVILAQDVVGYGLIFLINIPPLADFLCFEGLVRIIVSLSLVLFAVWSKADAHRVIGDYAWYWGDFFFLLDKSLVFDGIFQMFPHPMYTVGYLFMYGTIIFTKSYDVFYLSVFGHACQLVFLVLFENPHIEKTYNAYVEPSPLEKKRDEILYDDEDGYFKKGKELVTLINFDPKRAGDLLLAGMLVYTATLGLLPAIPAWVAVAQFIFWRFGVSSGVFYILWRQSRDHFWSSKFKTPKEAFDNWKPVYNATVTITNVSLIVCALRLFSWDASALFIFSTQMRLASFVVGGILIFLNMYVWFGVLEAVGEYGYFFGDFFLEDVPTRLTYDGIYRYMNNPDASLGYIAHYGFAILSGSPVMLALGISSHAVGKFFQYFIEEPHMEKKYGKSEMRKEGGGLKKGLVQNAKSMRKSLIERRKKYAEMIEKFKGRLESERTRYNSYVDDVRADRKAKKEKQADSTTTATTVGDKKED